MDRILWIISPALPSLTSVLNGSWGIFTFISILILIPSSFIKSFNVLDTFYVVISTQWLVCKHLGLLCRCGLPINIECSNQKWLCSTPYIFCPIDLLFDLQVCKPIDEDVKERLIVKRSSNILINGYYRISLRLVPGDGDKAVADMIHFRQYSFRINTHYF